MAVTYHNIYDKIKRKLKWENAFYLSVRKFLFYYLIYKNLHIEAGLFKTIVICVELSRIQAKGFENRVLSTMFEPNEDEVTGYLRKFRKRELHC